MTWFLFKFALNVFVIFKFYCILARFTRYSDHDLVIKVVPESLRGKNHYKVYQQYPLDIAERRKELYPKLREYRRQERRAKIVVDQLYVDGVWYPNGDPPQNQPTVHRPRTTETMMYH